MSQEQILKKFEMFEQVHENMKLFKAFSMTTDKQMYCRYSRFVDYQELSWCGGKISTTVVNSSIFNVMFITFNKHYNEN